jgi:hypothetical protein
MSVDTMSQSRVVDPDRPWLGLQHFEEATRDYFFGRDVEQRDLLERVQHRPLTVLFGQSGLGKTSLLRAGLVPRLSKAGFLPFVLRFSYEEGAPAPDTQFLGALAEALGRDLPEDVPLWLLLHDPQYGLCEETANAVNNATSPPRPVLILDQFEEIFTLGSRFRESENLVREVLAALVENRPPVDLGSRLSGDEALALRLRYEAQPVRVVLSLREDFLHALERWKKELPSIMENRIELRLLTGPQALEAVVEPGKMRCHNTNLPPLVSRPTGEAIVRFVAGVASDVPLEEIDAVPPLLSLLCAELNDQRGGPAEVIRPEQLDGRAEDILGRFYDRCLNKHPVAARAFVEDRLLSADGYRIQTTWNGALRELQENGLPITVSEKILADLVDDRLLVAEIHGKVRRIELTHDILTGIARRSRDLRHEREAVAKRRRARTHLFLIVFGAAVLISAISIPLAIWALHSKHQVEKANAQAIERQKDAEVARSREQRMRYDVYKTSFQIAQEAKHHGDAALWLGVAVKLGQDLGLDVMKDQLALIGNLSQNTIRPWPSAPPVEFSQMYTANDGTIWALSGTDIYEGRQDGKKGWEFRQTMADQGNCDLLVPFDGKFLALFNQKLRLLDPALGKAKPLPRLEDRPVQPALWVGEGKSFCYVEGEQVLRCTPGIGKIETVVRLDIPYGTRLWDFTTDDAFSVALFRASVGGERRLLVVDLHTGKILLNIAREVGYSPRRSGHLVFVPSGHEVIVVDLHDLRESWRLKMSWPVNQIADASDSGFATTHTDGKLRRWSLNGELQETVPVTNRTGYFNVHHLSSGAWVSGAGLISVLNDAKSPKPIATAMTSYATSLCSLDSERFALGTPNGVEVRSLADGRIIETIASGTYISECKASDTRLFIRSGNVITVYDLKTLRQKGQIHDLLDRSFFVLPDGSLLASRADGLFHFDAETSSERERAEINTDATILLQDSENIWIVKQDTELGQLRVRDFNLKTSRITDIISLGEDIGNLSALSLDGTSGRLLGGFDDGKVLIYPCVVCHPGDVVGKSTTVTTSGREKVSGIWSTPNGEFLVAREIGTLERYRWLPVGNVELVETLSPFGGGVVEEAEFPTPDRLLLRSAKGEYLCLNLRGGPKANARHNSAVGGQLCCRSDNFLAVPVRTSVVITNTDGEIRSIRGQKVTSSDFAKVVINPEHSLLAASDTEGAIYVWPLSASGETGECIMGPNLLGQLTCFTFVSNDELILANGKEAASLQVSSTQPPVPQWRRKLTERQNFSISYTVLLGDRLIAADSDGSTLLVVSQRGQGIVQEILMPETIRSLSIAGAMQNQLIVGGAAKLFVLRGDELALTQTVELRGADGTTNPYFVSAATALDGDLIAIGGKNRVWIARLEDSSPFMDLRVPDYVWGIQYSSKNHQLLWHGVAAWGAIDLPDFTAPPPSKAEVERSLGRTLSNGSEITPLKMFQVSPE